MKIQGPIPNKLYLACSGGADSMFGLHFLRNAKRDVIPIYFNHRTSFGEESQKFLENLNIGIVCGTMTERPTKGKSLEDFWRQQRYKFFDQFTDRPVITCHHLGDQIETMIMGFAHGKIRKIPVRRGNYLRPFLNVRKDEILSYCERHKVEYMDDPSNSDTRFARNRIRASIIPELLKVNPGLFKSLGKF